MLYESVGHLGSAAVVALSLLHNLKLQLVDAGLEQAFVELSILQKVDLSEQQVAQLSKALALVGAAAEHKGCIVIKSIGTGISTEAKLFLI